MVVRSCTGAGGTAGLEVRGSKALIKLSQGVKARYLFTEEQLWFLSRHWAQLEGAPSALMSWGKNPHGSYGKSHELHAASSSNFNVDAAKMCLT